MFVSRPVATPRRWVAVGLRARGARFTALLRERVRAWTTPLAPEHLELERYIVMIRWLGALLCLALIPFVRPPHAGFVFWCLLTIAGYNLAFSRLVRVGWPGWLVRLYAYGCFDTLSASALISLTGGLTSVFFPANFLIVVHAGIRFGRSVALLTGSLIAAYCVLFFRADEANARIVLQVGFIVLTALFAGMLADRTRAAEATVADQLRRTQALHVAGAALAGALSVPDVLQIVATEARRLVDAEIGIVECAVAGRQGETPECVTDVVPTGSYVAKLFLQHRRRADVAPLPDQEARATTLPEAFDVLGDVAPALPPVGLLHATLRLPLRAIGDIFVLRAAGRPPFAAADVAALDAFVAQARLALGAADLYQRVQMQAATDALTGLPNHRSLKERLDDEVARAVRRQDRLGVLMLDLDGFKAYNDAMGHAAGDAALQAVAAVLRGVTRRGTTVARYGGEEFAVLLPDASAADGVAVAERIRAGVAACAEANVALPQAFTVSIGVASYPEHGRDRDTLLQAADLAMYLAKQLGRDQVCTADELSTARGAEALVAQLTQHLYSSSGEWGPHIVTALERRFQRLARLSSPGAVGERDSDPYGSPVDVQLVTALAAAIDAKDHYTNGHSAQVAHLATLLARAAGQPEAFAELVRVAGQLHDIGKIGVPEMILHKPAALADDEWAIMRQHPDIGARILAPITALQPAIPIVRHHHERWDGRGYPHGLAGEAIPPGARIIAICDAYDTMVSNRPYRAALGHGDAIARLREAAGTQFDPALVEAFLTIPHVRAESAA